MSTLKLATQAAAATRSELYSPLSAAPAAAVPAGSDALMTLLKDQPPGAASPAAIQLATAVPSGAGTGTVGNALTALVQYVPTEVMTLYVAAVSVGTSFKSVIPTYTPTLLYWVFIALTPIIFYLVYLNQVVSGKQPIPRVKDWPRWKPAASTISFGVWALAIPNNPYIQGDGGAGAAVAGFAALFVSTILSLLAPIVERQP